MASFLESLADGIQKRWCALSTDDIVLGGLVAAGSGVGLPALGIAGVVGVARQASDQICSKSTPSPSYQLPPPPPNEGQCEGVNYLVKCAYTDLASNPPVERTVPPSGQGVSVAGIVEGVANLDPNTFGVQSSTAGFVTFLAAGNGAFVGNFRIIEIVRADGLPDDCGSSEPTIEPIPEYDDVLPDIPFEDDSGNPVNFPNLPVKFFPPCITLEGVKVPFEITTPLGRICGQVIAKPDIKTGVRPKVDFDLCPSERQTLEPAIPEKMKDYFDLSDEIGSIAAPFPASDYGNIPSLQADEKKPIMGVFLECGTDGSDKGKATKIFNDDENSDAPTLFVPRIGYVRFWMLAEREGADAVQWSLPIEIKQPRAFIPCPSPFGALAVDVQMLDGYQAKYKVAKRKTCCEACEKFDPNAPNDALDRCD